MASKDLKTFTREEVAKVGYGTFLGFMNLTWFYAGSTTSLTT